MSMDVDTDDHITSHLHGELVGRVFYAQALKDGAWVRRVGDAVHTLLRLAEGHGVVVKGQLRLKGRQRVDLCCGEQREGATRCGY